MKATLSRLFLPAAICIVAFLNIGAGKKEQTIRLLYWNIQNGMWDGQGDNYDRFVNWVKDKNPDICVWCEAEDHKVTGTSQSIPPEERYLLHGGWQELMQRYGHKYMFVSGKRDAFPQVITSKYPIDTVGQFIGEKPDSVVQHGAGWARIVIEGKEFNIVTLHLQPFGYYRGIPKEQREESKRNYGGEKYRRMEMEWILNHTVRTVDNPGKGLWMMMGDFNSRSRKDNFKYKWSDASEDFLTHNYIEDTAPYYYDVIAEMYPGTFVSSTYGQARVDYIYVTKPVLKAITYAETIRDAYTKPVYSGVSNFYNPSDHLPIMMDINLKKIK